MSDITKPEIKTQAINEIENLKDNTENIIRILGGDFPPTTHPCSGGGSKNRFKKRLFNPIGAVEGLANDALGLAGCVDDIVNDISNEIGPITGPPPPPDVIDSITTQLDALEKAGEEEEDDDDDQSSSQQSNSQSRTSTGSDSSSATSSPSSQTSGSSTSSSQTSSSTTSSAASGCPSYVDPGDDITEWEGTPDPGTDGPAKRMFAMKSRSEMKGRWAGNPRGVDNRFSNVNDNPDGRNELAKREQGPPINEVNGCTFPGGQQGVQPGYSARKGFLNLGKNPGGNGGLSGAVYKAAPKWYVGQHSCSLPNSFKWFKTTDERPDGIPTTPVMSLQSIDHVCKSRSVAIIFILVY